MFFLQRPDVRQVLQLRGQWPSARARPKPGHSSPADNQSVCHVQRRRDFQFQLFLLQRHRPKRRPEVLFLQRPEVHQVR